MTQINDASTSKAMDVQSNGRALIQGALPGDSTHETLQGWAFTVTVATTTVVGPGDYFLKLANISTDPLWITGIELEDAGAEDIIGSLSANYAGASTAASAFVVTNRYFGSTNVYSTKATVESDTNMTGQPGAIYEVFRRQAAAGVMAQWDIKPNPIILMANQAFSLSAETGTTAITTIKVHYHHLMEPRNS